MFEKHLSFPIKYAYESYVRTEEQIERKLKSEQERLKQQPQAEDSVLILKRALADFRRLQEGKGTKDEVDTFQMFFRTSKNYYSAEEMPQTKLFSFD